MPETTTRKDTSGILDKPAAFALFNMLKEMSKVLKSISRTNVAELCNIVDMRADLQGRWNAQIKRLASAKDLSHVADQPLKGSDQKIALSAPELAAIASAGFGVRFDKIELADD